MLEGTLGSLDIGIFVVYALILMGMGIYYTRKTRTSEQFMVAGRTIPAAPILRRLLQHDWCKSADPRNTPDDQAPRSGPHFSQYCRILPSAGSSTIHKMQEAHYLFGKFPYTHLFVPYSAKNPMRGF